MEIKLHELKEGKPFSLEGEIDFSYVKNPLPNVISIKDNKVKVCAKRYDDLVIIDFDISATLSAISSYTNKVGDYLLKTQDTITFSLKEDDEYDVIDGNSVVLDEYVYSLIITSIPITIIFKGETLPKEIDGIRVIVTEEEVEAEEKKQKSSPFDALDGLFKD